MFSQLNSLIDVISKEKGVNKKVIIGALESSFISIVRKKLGELGSIATLEATYSPNDDDVHVYQYKRVLSDKEGTEDRVLSEVELMTSILYKDAVLVDDAIEVGDELGFPVSQTLKELNRKNIQVFKQLLVQKINDAERKNVLDLFSDKKGKIVSGTIKLIDDKGNALVSLGATDAILYKKDMMDTDNFSKNNRISALLLDVSRSGGRQPAVILSRNSHLFLMKKMEDGCDKIEDGVIEIVSIAREGGLRSKVVVKSNDSSVNPLSEILGDNGYKIQSISDDLDGEKINIIQYTENRTELIMNCLKPGTILSYSENEETGIIEVLVEKDELGKVIGKKGSNLRTAASILGKRINVVAKENLLELKTLAREELSLVSKLTLLLTEKLINEKIFSVQKLGTLSSEEISNLLEVDAETADSILKESKALSEEKTYTPCTDQVSLVSSYGIPKEFLIPVQEQKSIKSAELRLREELSAFKLK